MKHKPQAGTPSLRNGDAGGPRIDRVAALIQTQQRRIARELAQARAALRKRKRPGKLNLPAWIEQHRAEIEAYVFSKRQRTPDALAPLPGT